ncbi:DUF397 domain-containing protein [Micromonospora sp. NBC_01796]|uniref:DUF397 domain-containing protein n=1 Tax=Micromonospora sp. NBC_01796 TaxID=2975987 RepID=UPI002DD8B678|nr:DUF397 domain-containing protein [Micromonospora sp. NBC_01796]WSA88593.1 DUF397 domain-containing protein [Micromonospora sp. NBC_01796]
MNEPQFLDFRRTSKSDGGQNCVEVADAVDASAVRVRDSKDQTGPVLEFGGVGWRAFIATVQNGELTTNA